jgi:hypothetical protein
MAQKIYKAKITLFSGGNAIEVRVPANDIWQAKKVIEAQYGPVRTYFYGPSEEK